MDVSRFDDLLASGTDDGKVTSLMLGDNDTDGSPSFIHSQIAIHELPTLSSFSKGSSLAPNTLLSLSHPSARPIDTLSFHPTTSSLFLASSQSTVAVYDIQSQASAPAFQIDQSSPSWSAKWSGDGRMISTTGKDGILRVWDVRKDSSKAALVGDSAFSPPSALADPFLTNYRSSRLTEA